MSESSPPSVKPIAIVGMGGRFPGDASSPDRLWELILEAKSTLSDTPKDRFNADAFYHPQPDRSGTQNFRGGHFMNQPIDVFDAPFFSISPNEAKAMDPQQRMCLEVAYEAMENAGIRLDQVSGSSTSCYVGCFNYDYHTILSQDPANLPFYYATGTEPACLSNRVSWSFNLSGPSLTLDTACSSSLVALHLACQSLRTGESDMSLVGGVNIISCPDKNFELSNLQMTSPDSKSKTFDEKANGYGRGEGVSFVVIKPLDKAIEDNDVIRAVIRNTGCNQDGHTSGLTLPSETAQKNLIRKVYKQANLHLGDTGYFEAHGTGTVAGDSTETKAMGETIGQARPANQPLCIGSVKANIGHLEGVSGLAGLIKTVYVLETGHIPPQIWFDKLNPRIKVKEWNLKIPTEVMEWPSPGVRRASINSFGFSGTNAHAVIDDAYSFLEGYGGRGCHVCVPCPGLGTVGIGDPEDENEIPSPLHPELIVWSSHEQTGLRRISDSWRNYLDKKSQSMSMSQRRRLLRNLAYTAAERRTRLPWKSFRVCSTIEDMIEENTPSALPVRSSQHPKIAFVFTGQGAQYPSMGRSLMAYRVFADSMNAADAHFRSLGCQWSLVEELLREETLSRVRNAEFSHPLCVALQVGLVDLLRSVGIGCPEFVVGHSGGETAAAYAKGALTRESAWAVAYYRGQCASVFPSLAPDLRGDMLAVGVGEREAKKYVEQITSGFLDIACINSPNSVTLSGDLSAILDAESLIKADGHLAKRLCVNMAYHSWHMQVVADKYRSFLGDIKSLPETDDAPKMLSSVTGEVVQNSELGTEYWVSNVLNQVRFSQAVQALIEHTDDGSKGDCSVDLMVEIGPHGALQGPVKQILNATNAECTCITMQDRKKDAAHSFLEGIGALFQHGCQPNLSRANILDAEDEPRLLVDLPPYAWNDSHHHWHESSLSANCRQKGSARIGLLGSRESERNDNEPRWRNYLRLHEHPWLEEHQIQSNSIFPAAGMIAMVLQTAQEMSHSNKEVDSYEPLDIEIKTALIIPSSDEGVETLLQLHRVRKSMESTTASAWYEFALYSRNGINPWSENCSGLVCVRYQTEFDDAAFINEEAILNHTYHQLYMNAEKTCSKSLVPAEFYTQQAESGFTLGEAFQNVTAINMGKDEMLYTVHVPDMKARMPHRYKHQHLIHPCTLDSLIHAALAVVNDEQQNKGPAVPISIGRVNISASIPSDPGSVLRGHLKATPHGLTGSEIDLCASSEDWKKPLIILEKMNLARLGSAESPNDDGDLRKIASKMVWREDIGFIDNESLSTGCASQTSVGSLLRYFMQLLGHKYPSLRVLEVGASDLELTEHILGHLEGKDGDSAPWLGRYTATAVDEEVVKALRERFESWGQRFHGIKFQPEQDVEDQGLKSHSYDCILVKNGDNELSRLDEVIQNIRGLLKENGVLVVLHDEVPNHHEWTEWTEALKNDGLDSTDYTMGNHPKSASSFPFTVLKEHHPPEVPKDVLIIGSCAQDPPTKPLSDALMEDLEKQGSHPRHATLYETREMDLQNTHCIVLAELVHPILFDIGSECFLLIKRLILESKSTIWLASSVRANTEQDPQSSLVIGLARTVRQEHPEVSFTTVDLDGAAMESSSSAEILTRLCTRRATDEMDFEFVLQGHRVLIPRIQVDEGLNDLASSSVQGGAVKKELQPFKQLDRNLTLAIEGSGGTDSIFFEDSHSHEKGLLENEVEIEMHASGLNLSDVTAVMGHVSNPEFGFECSGIIRHVGSVVTKYRPGDGVIAWQSGSFSNYTRVPESMVYPMPANMSFEEAAALPMSYCTAYQGLIECARLQKDETVLIHSAAGDIGQAAVCVAQSLGANVYATVETTDQKKIIMETFNIPSDHILSNRQPGLASGISRLTNGAGVDVILNNLTGECVQESWASLACSGRLIDIGENAIFDCIGLKQAVSTNLQFNSVEILDLNRHHPSDASKLFQNAMHFYEEHHCIPPSPLHVLGFSDMSDGMQRLHNDRNTGKIVFKANKNDQVLAVPQAIKPTQFHHDATYLIVGGFGGIGQYISRWMVSHGARHLLFLSRRGPNDPDAQAFLHELSDSGARAIAYSCDICDRDSVRGAVSRCTRDGMPPIRGVIQAAMSLADATFEQMTPKQWRSSANTKALGTWNLHCSVPRELDFFLMLSSVSGVIGWRGQGNYAAGNTFLDSLAQYRRAQGLPAVSIDVGSVFDVGYVAQRPEMQKSMQSQGLVGITGDELLRVIQVAISGQTDAQIIMGLATGGHLAAENIETPYYYSDAKMSHLRETSMTHHQEDDNSTGPQLQEKLSNATDPLSATNIVRDALCAKLANQMMVATEDIDARSPVTNYGIDSLKAVDLRSWSLKEAKADISVLDVVHNATIGSLAEMVVQRSSLTC